MRNSSTKIKELTAEAEARDKLIETFSKILLQRIDVGEVGEGLTMDSAGDVAEAEKLSEVMLLNESIEALKPPT